MATTKQTVLHSWHVANGANMALFGNYDMPLWYKTGAKAEHLAVIQGAGIFDTSHMAAVSVQGKGARTLLQRCLSKNIDCCLGQGKSPLVDGRCVYGVFLKKDGTVIDDAIVYQLQPESFMVVVNAGMGGTIAAHLIEHDGDGAVTVVDLTDRVGKMDIQGPDSARILGKIIKNPTAVFDRLVYFSCKGGFADLQTSTSAELVDGTPLLVSRTGYTGEFGFELFVPIDRLTSVCPPRETLMAQPDLKTYRDRMDKAVVALKEEFAGLRTGRANVGLLDPVQVQAYGSTSPLNSVAAISVPEPRMISVNVWDKSMVGPVEKAIRAAGLGLNPIVDGQTLRIPVPPLTEERRKELAKLAGKYAEQQKISVRNVRRDANDDLKKAEKASEISQDDQKRMETEVQKDTDAVIKRIDEALKAKEVEIMQV